VQSLLLDLSQAVEERIRSTFDLNKISKDVAAKGKVLRAENISSADRIGRTFEHWEPIITPNL
jgi:hypothetical protein